MNGILDPATWHGDYSILDRSGQLRHLGTAQPGHADAPVLRHVDVMLLRHKLHLETQSLPSHGLHPAHAAASRSLKADSFALHATKHPPLGLGAVLARTCLSGGEAGEGEHPDLRRHVRPIACAKRYRRSAMNRHSAKHSAAKVQWERADDRGEYGACLCEGMFAHACWCLGSCFGQAGPGCVVPAI